MNIETEYIKEMSDFHTSYNPIDFLNISFQVEKSIQIEREELER